MLLVKTWKRFVFFFNSVTQQKKTWRDQKRLVGSVSRQRGAEKNGKSSFRTGSVLSLGYSEIIQQPYGIQCMYVFNSIANRRGAMQWIKQTLVRPKSIGRGIACDRYGFRAFRPSRSDIREGVILIYLLYNFTFSRQNLVVVWFIEHSESANTFRSPNKGVSGK